MQHLTIVPHGESGAVVLPASVLESIGREHVPNLLRASVLVPVLLLGLLVSDAGFTYPADFPSAKFPVELIAKHRSLLEGSRLFTLDAWGDYLIYRHYPRQQVFFDGRTDYYGQRMSEEYLALVNGGPGWRRSLEKYRINAVMLSTASPLAQSLAIDPKWQFVDQRDEVALYRLRN